MHEGKKDPEHVSDSFFPKSHNTMISQLLIINLTGPRRAPKTNARCETACGKNFQMGKE